MVIQWKKLPKELQAKMSLESSRVAPRLPQEKRSSEDKANMRIRKESFIAELIKKDGKYHGTHKKFT